MLILFAGPSLAACDVPPGITVLPPAAQGDVYRAARVRPWGIGIVDGFFEHVPAVWHKEILWALAHGVRVFGAASMGALRAAELADFGMIGIGRIFERYRANELTADDEVCVAHLAAEHGYRRVSEALVDVRATLEAAVYQGSCSAALADALLAAAHAMFYPERTWPKIVAATRAPSEALRAFERWLAAGRVDQKRQDALALVEAMRAARQHDEPPPAATFAFERTDIWERAVPRMASASDAPSGAGELAEVVDELRLLGDEALYAFAIQGALLRGLAEELVEKHAVAFGPELLQRTAIELRRAHGLHAADANRAWLDEQGLDAASYARLMRSEAAVKWTAAVSEPEIFRHLPDQLRAMSCHGRLQRQARAKRHAVARAGLDVDALVAAADETLWQWYFGERLGRKPPYDLGAYAGRLGYASVDAMRIAVAVERWFAERGRP